MTVNRVDARGQGYDPYFLGVELAVPAPSAEILDDVLQWEGGAVLPYTHFSLAMSVARRFAYWVAWNIDGGDLKKLSRANLTFVDDRRIPAAAQVGNEVYARNPLDRGHLARRSDLTWGPLEEAQQANIDSFCFTNIVPQVDDFNQSGRQGVWGRLEDALYEEVEVDGLRVCVMAAPVFRDNDTVYRSVALPREFWKVLAYSRNNELAVRAFLLAQDLDPVRAVTALDEFHAYQVELSELEQRTGLVFSPVMHAAGVRMTASADGAARAPLAKAADIRW
ncbi:MAG: DNA/RNA non-specific endonuclease [Rhodoglobus sp.]